MKRILFALLLIISGCTVKLQDARLDPNAVQNAINNQADLQRGLAQAVNGIVALLKEKGILVTPPKDEKAPTLSQ